MIKVQRYEKRAVLEHIDLTSMKVFSLATSDGFRRSEVRGTYQLSNLLQQLVIAQGAGLEVASIEAEKLTENPVSRFSRRIRDMFWPNLARRLDESLIGIAAKDPKDWTNGGSRIYVPFKESEQ